MHWFIYWKNGHNGKKYMEDILKIVTINNNNEGNETVEIGLNKCFSLHNL